MKGIRGVFSGQKIFDTWAVSSSLMVILSELVLIDLVNSQN